MPPQQGPPVLGVDANDREGPFHCEEVLQHFHGCNHPPPGHRALASVVGGGRGCKGGAAPTCTSSSVQVQHGGKGCPGGWVAWFLVRQPVPSSSQCTPHAKATARELHGGPRGALKGGKGREGWPFNSLPGDQPPPSPP